MSVLEYLLVAVLAILTLAAVLGSMLAVGWTLARLRIWSAEARFVETQAGPARPGGDRDA